MVEDEMSRLLVSSFGREKRERGSVSLSLSLSLSLSRKEAERSEVEPENLKAFPLVQEPHTRGRERERGYRVQHSKSVIFLNARFSTFKKLSAFHGGKKLSQNESRGLRSKNASKVRRFWCIPFTTLLLGGKKKERNKSPQSDSNKRPSRLSFRAFHRTTEKLNFSLLDREIYSGMLFQLSYKGI